MRFTTVAIAAAALFGGALAQDPHQYTSSATTTWTVTRTVSRVEATTTATHNDTIVPSRSSTSWASAATASAAHSNGTWTSTTSHSTTAPTAKATPATGSAVRLGMEIGMAAVVGLVGLAAL